MEININRTKPVFPFGRKPGPVECPCPHCKATIRPFVLGMKAIGREMPKGLDTFIANCHGDPEKIAHVLEARVEYKKRRAEAARRINDPEAIKKRSILLERRALEKRLGRALLPQRQYQPSEFLPAACAGSGQKARRGAKSPRPPRA